MQQRGAAPRLSAAHFYEPKYKPAAAPHFAMDRVFGEMAKQAGVPPRVLRDHAGTLISFLMFHSNALLRPRNLGEKLMVYALFATLVFAAHAIWVVFMYLLDLVLGNYAIVAHCVLAVGVPTFGITLPVYRFKQYQSLRRQPTTHQAAPPVIPARRR